jgi:hypothetical protein
MLPWLSCVEHGPDMSLKDQGFDARILQNQFGWHIRASLAKPALNGRIVLIWRPGHGILKRFLKGFSLARTHPHPDGLPAGQKDLAGKQRQAGTCFERLALNCFDWHKILRLID